MDNIQIDKMTLSDLEVISHILYSEFDDFWTIDTLKAELNNENSYYIVAKQNNIIIGFAGIWKSVDCVHITNIVVKKDFRNKGIATLLLKKLIEKTKELEFTELTLEVNVNNIYAKKLYLNFGFKELGIRKKYYNNTYDASIMTLYL